MTDFKIYTLMALISASFAGLSGCDKGNNMTASDFSLSPNGRLIYNQPLKQLKNEQHSFYSYDMQTGTKQDEIMVRDGHLFVLDAVDREFSDMMLSEKSMAVDCLEITVSHSQFGSRKQSICQANKNVSTEGQSYSGNGDHAVTLQKGELFYIYEDLGGGSLGGMPTGKHYRCLMTDELETKIEGACKFNLTQAAPSSLSGVDEVVSSEAKKFSKGLPVVILDSLKILSANADGSTLSFDFQMLTVDIEAIDKDSAVNILKTEQLKEYCTVAHYDNLRQPGITTKFNYTDTNDAHVVTISLSASDCT